MNDSTPQSLLSLPAEMKSPEAYRVLGLKEFESDRAKIKVAAETILTRLKDAKATADKATWETAILWTKNAYAILGDAGKKAAYDRRLQTENAARVPLIDPLAGFLPGAPALPVPPTQSRPTFRPGQISPLVGSASDSLVAKPTAELSIPFVKGRPSIKRKPGLPWVSIFLSLFCVLSISGLGGIAYVVFSGKAIVISARDGSLISSANVEGQIIARPGDIAPRVKRPFDPVMGGLAGEIPPPSTAEMVVESALLPSSAVTPEIPAAQTPAPITKMPAPIPAATPAPEMTEPTPEQIQAGDKALAAVIAAIKRHDWNKLKSLAEVATSIAASDTQKEQAEMIFQLIDLATFYRGGIVKALATLQAGNELELKGDIKVVIVEAGPDKLIIRFNGKNKAYTLETLPPSIANKLAKLSMSADSPTTQAAMNAYQAIAPLTNSADRELAIAELEKITAEIEGAEPAKLISAIRLLYQP